MNFKMCGGLFSFCFLHGTVFGNGQVAITHNVEAFTMCGYLKNVSPRQVMQLNRKQTD